MSSMRNAVQRRNHRERAQPKERERWGLLEKHKDYSLRAQDYGIKKARIKTLRTKAAERNPDEFHHGMLSSQTNKGRKIADRGNEVLSHEAVKLLKTQDSGYLRAMIQKTQKQIERLEEDFILQPYSGGVVANGMGNQESHGGTVIFCETVEGQSQVEAHLKSYSSKHQVDTSNKSERSQDPQRSHKQAEREQQAHRDHLAWRKAAKKAKDARIARLAALRSRKSGLLAAENELETQRARMNNTVGGTNRTGIKFKIRERKR